AFNDLLTDQLFETVYQGRQPVLVAPPGCTSAVALRCLTETQTLGLKLAYVDPQAGTDQDKDAWVKPAYDLVRADHDLVLLPFSRYDCFMSLTLEAEYVFYWNLISASVVVRIVNGLPFFCFERGHIAHYSPALFSRNLQCYLAGSCPPCLPMTEPLEAGELAPPAPGPAPAMNAAAETLLKGRPPVEVVRRLMERPA